MRTTIKLSHLIL